MRELIEATNITEKVKESLDIRGIASNPEQLLMGEDYVIRLEKNIEMRIDFELKDELIPLFKKFYNKKPDWRQ